VPSALTMPFADLSSPSTNSPSTPLRFCQPENRLCRICNEFLLIAGRHIDTFTSSFFHFSTLLSLRGKIKACPLIARPLLRTSPLRPFFTSLFLYIHELEDGRYPFGRVAFVQLRRRHIAQQAELRVARGQEHLAALPTHRTMGVRSTIIRRSNAQSAWRGENGTGATWRAQAIAPRRSHPWPSRR
jgi:hypothetical protein